MERHYGEGVTEALNRLGPALGDADDEERAFVQCAAALTLARSEW